jgi:hypothetical protein
MARTLYRIYLYLMLTLLLTFSAGTTAAFLSALFLQAANYVPQYGGSNDLALAAVQAFVTLVVTAIFGGQHYWLIRRDIAHDPGASKGAVRSLFLNLIEASAALVVMVAGVIFFTQIGPNGVGAVSSLGIAASFAILFGLIELERRRDQPERGGAVVLQHLHLYGIQLIALFIATFFVLNALNQTVGRLIINTGYAPDPCIAEQTQHGSCPFDTGQYLGGLWLAAIWLAAIWVGYGLLARNDLTSRLRVVFHLLGLAFSVVFVIIGVGMGANVLLRGLFGAPDPYSPVNDPAAPFENAQYQFAFIAFLAFGLAVVATYWVWLRLDARRGGVMGTEMTLQTTLAITTALAAIPFWIGCALTLGGLFERTGPSGSPPDAAGWAGDLALVAAGVIYIPLALWVGALARRTGVTTPRRGFVYVLLALGTPTAVFSLISVLYELMVNSIGKALPNWEQFARQGTANVLVGAILVGIYVFIARREGWFTRPPASAEAPTAAPRAETIESVLDELLAHTLSRDEAAARIRALAARGS